MARYSTFKYGSGQEYGTSPTTTNLLWTFIVMWGEFYTGENEADQMIGLTVERGRDNLVHPAGEGLEHYSPGRAVAILDNDDGRYDPFNASSPLYPNVEPGKFCRLQVKNGNTGTDYGIMRGVIADIRTFTEGNRRKVAITLLDGLQWLKDRTVKVRDSSLGYQEYTWQAAYRILVAANWPVDEWGTIESDDGYVGEYGGPILVTDFETFGNARPGYKAWLKNALSELEALFDYEMGAIFHDRDGQIRVIPGNFDRYDDTNISESQVLTDIFLPMPWDVIRNRVQVAVYNLVYDLNFNAAFWQLAGGVGGVAAPALNAGQTIVLEAQFSVQGDEVYGLDGVLNHAVNTQQSGGGTNLTTNCPARFDGDHVDFGTWSSSAIAEGTTITISNNSGSNGFIITLDITGDIIYIRMMTAAAAEDAGSIAKFGTRLIQVDNRWVRNATYAQQIANWWRDYFAEAKLYPVIKIEQRPTLQYPPDLYGNVISLSVPTLGINSEFRIGKIEHRWLRENGQAVETVFKLEPWATPFG